MKHLDKILTDIDPQCIEVNDPIPDFDLEDTIDLTEVLDQTQEIEMGDNND